MTTDLRKQVVEAMAQAMYLLDWPDGWVENAEAGIINQHVWRDQAEAALDAALDVLGEQHTRWERTAEFYEGNWELALIAALRDMRELVLRAGKGSE